MEAENINPKELDNINKVIQGFLKKSELLTGQAYTADKEEMAKEWTKRIVGENPQLTAMQLKESAVNALNHLLNLPSYKQFIVLSRIVVETKEERKAISPQEWEEVFGKE